MKPTARLLVYLGAALTFGTVFSVGYVAVRASSGVVAVSDYESAVYPYQIEIIPASKTISPSFVNVSSPYTDANLILQSNSITAYPEDKIITFPDPSWGMGGLIKLERAPVVYLDDGGQKSAIRTWSATVLEMMKTNNVAPLGTSDSITPSLNTEISDGMTVQITRVAITDEVNNQTIPYNTIRENDPNLYRGQSFVSQAGVDGETQLTYRLVRQNGVLVSRTLINTQVLTQKKDKIIEIGTRLKIGAVFNYQQATYNPFLPDGYAASDYYGGGVDLLIINKDNGKSVEIKTWPGGNQGSNIDLSENDFINISSAGSSQGRLYDVTIEQVLN